MRKLISLTLALVMILSLSTVAFAAEGETTATPTYTDMETVTIQKTYTVTNDNTSYPDETFEFSISSEYVVEDGGVGSNDQDIPSIGSVAFDTEDGTATRDVTITLPTYTAVGKYSYTIRETVGDTAGVIYHGDPITLVVTVIQGSDSKIRVAAVHAEAEGGEKTDAIENVYNAGAISVKKIVEGALGDREKYFEITVTLTGETGKDYSGNVIAVSGGSYAENPTSVSVGTPATFHLKHNETINLGNIPYGVSYTVTEADLEDYEEVITGGDSNGTGTVSDASEAQVLVTNTKEGTPETGISMDSVPYVLLLAVATLGLAVLFTKKRMMR